MVPSPEPFKSSEPTFEEAYAAADSIEERERVLNEYLGEIDFDTPLDQIQP